MAKPLVNYAPVQLVLSGQSANFNPTLTQGTGVSWSGTNLPNGAGVNTTGGSITGTLSTLGKWETELIATNADGVFRLKVPFIVYSSIVTVNSGWLADPANQHDDGWKIEGGSVNNSHKIFRLAQDVTSTKTAFWIADANVYLDLNGYAIHYGSNSTTDEFGVGMYTSEYFTATTYISPSQTTTIANRSDPLNCAVFNGSIINDGTGNRSHGICCHRSYGLLVAEIIISTAGKDSCAIYSHFTQNGGLQVINNQLYSNLTDTFNRHSGPACLQSSAGAVYAENNLISGQNSSINCNSSSVIRRNVLSHAGAFTNGYGVWLYRTSNVQAYDNIIVPTNGRGILLNGYGTTQNNSFTNNVILHMEEGNGEFGNNLNPPAYRLRYTTSNNLFSGNTTLGIAGGIHCAASSIYLSTYVGAVEDVVKDNNCTVICEGSISTTNYAQPITLEGCGADKNGTTVTRGSICNVNNNTFKSNAFMIRTEGYDGFTVQETPLENNTFEWVDANTALSGFFATVDTKLVELGLKSGVNAAANTAIDAAYAIASHVSGVSLQTSKAFWYTKFISHDGTLSYVDLLNSTYGADVDPETYSYASSTLSAGSARYREGITQEVQVLLNGSPVANTVLTVTTTDGDTYEVTTDGSGMADFKFFNFAIEKANPAGSPFTTRSITSSTITLGGDSAIVNHSNIPATVSLQPSPPTPPVNTLAPVLSGTPTEGQTLSCTSGDWDYSPTYTYQWYKNVTNSTSGGTLISGAILSTYTLTSSEIGLYIYCVITATNSDGSVTANSSILGPVLPISNLTNPQVVTYSTARFNGTITNLTIARPTGVTSGELLILFTNCSSTISVTSSGFTRLGLKGSDNDISRLSAFYRVAGASEPTGYVLACNGPSTFMNAGLIRVSGALNPSGNPIECVSGGGTANPSIAPSVTPSDATSLVIRAVSVGRQNGYISATPATQIFINSINNEFPHLAASWENCDNTPSLTANFTQPNGREYAAFSIAIAPAVVVPQNITAPSIFGLNIEGQTLQSTQGFWNYGNTYGYQWYRNSISGTSGSSGVTGQTSSTYNLTSIDIDKYLYCEVSASNSAGSSSVLSDIAGPIASSGLPPVNSGSPVINGILTVGESLYCTSGVWINSPDFYTYQWYRNTFNSNSNGITIGDAIYSGYALTNNEVGQYMYCVVNASNEKGEAQQPSNVLGIVSATPTISTVTPRIIMYHPLR